MNNNTKKKLTFAAMSSTPSRATGSSNSTGNPYLFQSSTGRPSTPESGAMFRSVSMGVAEPPPLFAHSTAFGGLSKSHSTPIPDSHFDVASPTFSTAAPSTGKPAAEDWSWRLTPKQVLPVPIYHPMERSAVTLTDVPVEEITKRISAFLKQHSIPAKYEDEKSRVSCVTDNLVKFVVQLWKLPADGGVVVEIQRRQGCCVEMQGIRHHLLEAIATGAAFEPAPKPTRTTCGIVQTLLEQANLPPPPASLPCSAAALELAKRLLQSDRLDAQRLGLESLCSLTNPSQVLLRDSDIISKTVLCDPDWQVLLGRYFHSNLLDDNLDDKNEYPDDTVKLNYQQGEFYGALHFFALKVICQAVESLASTGSTVDFTSTFWETVLKALYYNLTVAVQRPLEAAWSIRCFRHLQLLQPDFLRLIPNKRGLYECLVHARDFGKQHHRSLEMETEQLMGRLGFAY